MIKAVAISCSRRSGINEACGETREVVGTMRAYETELDQQVVESGANCKRYAQPPETVTEGNDHTKESVCVCVCFVRCVLCVF